MAYGLRMYQLWRALQGGPRSRMELLAEGFYDVLLADAREHGHVKPAPQKTCPTCGSIRAPLMLQWTGNPPVITLRSMGAVNAAKVATLTANHTVVLQRTSDGQFKITLDVEPPKNRKCLVWRHAVTGECIRNCVEEWCG